jgi:hypothetical protein
MRIPLYQLWLLAPLVSASLNEIEVLRDEHGIAHTAACTRTEEDYWEDWKDAQCSEIECEALVKNSCYVVVCGKCEQRSIKEKTVAPKCFKHTHEKY